MVKATCPVWGALGGIPLLRGSMDAVLRLHSIPAQDSRLTVVVGWDNPVCRESVK